MGKGVGVLVAVGLICAGCVRGLAVEPLQAQGDKKPPVTDAQALKELNKRKPPHVEVFLISERLMPESKPGAVTFRDQVFFRNTSSSQISEVSVCYQMLSRSTGKETYRSKPQKLIEFMCDRVPHVGTLEAFCRTTNAAELTFDIPVEEWTTDSMRGLVVVDAKAVADESNLHDFGNLISFVVWHNDRDIEAAFLKDPALFKLHNSVGVNPAMIAAADGSPALLDFMLQHGIDLKDHTPGGKNLMYAALGSQDSEMLSKVVSLGFSVNERFGESKRTPLMEAINEASFESVKWLLAHGADPSVVDGYGYTPLDLAICGPEILDSPIFDELIAAKADYRHVLADGSNLLYNAITFRYQATVEKLVNLGLDVNCRMTKTGMTPLMWSARQGTGGISKFLVSKGAKLDAVDNEGQTVFDYAKKATTLNTDEFFRKAIGIK